MQGVLHMLLRNGSSAAVAASAFDVPGVLAAANDLARGLAGRLLPGFVAGHGTYARQLFRKDGFFAYADERQAQVGGLCRCYVTCYVTGCTTGFGVTIIVSLLDEAFTC
jgi:hypothetical protein